MNALGINVAYENVDSMSPVDVSRVVPMAVDDVDTGLSFSNLAISASSSVASKVSDAINDLHHGRPRLRPPQECIREISAGYAS